MHGDKLRTLCDGVAQSIGSMRGNDRFRIVTFNQQSREVTRGWVAASPDAIREWTRRVSELKANGSTNLEAGIRTALGGIDADRVTSLILVTDAVTNTGEVRPGRIREADAAKGHPRLRVPDGQQRELAADADHLRCLRRFLCGRVELR